VAERLLAYQDCPCFMELVTSVAQWFT